MHCKMQQIIMQTATQPKRKKPNLLILFAFNELAWLLR